MIYMTGFPGESTVSDQRARKKQAMTSDSNNNGQRGVRELVAAVGVLRLEEDAESSDEAAARDEHGLAVSVCWAEARHRELICGTSASESDAHDQWRMRDRMKTVSVALVLCLNIGVDPPDVVKVQGVWLE